MKKSYIAAAVAVVLVGLAGVHQVTYKAQVQAGVEQLANEITTSVLLENGFKATPHSQQSNFFTSTGAITVVTTGEDELNEVEVEYTVSHGPLSFLTGAGYKVNIVNTAFFGDTNKTITASLMNNQPITIQGSLRRNSISGTMEVPAINLNEGNFSIQVEPVITKFYASNFNSYGSADSYKITVHSPSYRISEDGLQLDILNSSLQVNSVLNESSAFSDVDFELEKVNGWFINNNNNKADLLLSNMALSSRLKVKKELENTVAFNLESLSLGSDHYENAELSYEFSGIHGPIALEVMHLTRNANHKKWEDSELLDAIINLLFERAPELLSLNPEFNIHTLKANKNGELFLNANSSALLDSSKLPSNFAASLEQLNVFSTSTALLNALQLNVDAEFGPDFAESISRVNPLLGAVISSHNDSLSFSMKNGETTLNGSKL